MQARRANRVANPILAALLTLMIAAAAVLAGKTNTTNSKTADPPAAPEPAPPAGASDAGTAAAPAAATTAAPSPVPGANPATTPVTTPAAAPATKPVAPNSKEAPRAALGKPAPDFTLTDTEGVQHHLADYIQEGKTVVLEWFNPDCPFVRKHHQKTDSMKNTYAYCKDRNVIWLAINSGAPGKQGNGLERNRKAIRDYGIQYPLLLDESGVVGKMYGAKTTPDMFVIYKGNLVYEGAIDNNPSPAGDLGDRNYVREAIDACTTGKPVGTAMTRSYGCSVKYAS